MASHHPALKVLQAVRQSYQFAYSGLVIALRPIARRAVINYHHV